MTGAPQPDDRASDVPVSFLHCKVTILDLENLFKFPLRLLPGPQPATGFRLPAGFQG